MDALRRRVSRFGAHARLPAEMCIGDRGSNVTEAALESGFQNVSYFIQLYKNKYGVTPHKSK